MPIAVVEIGGRLRGMDADGVVFRDYKKAPPGLPRVTDLDRDHVGRRSGRRRKVISALPQELSLRVDHVQVTSVDQISLVLKDGRVVSWGSADESDRRPRSSPCSSPPSQAPFYDVSVPSKPATADQVPS